MKKKLSADALDILAVAAISGWPMLGSELEAVAELVVRSYVMAEKNVLGVVLLPTTAGVRFLINRGIVVQEGTKFALAGDVRTERQREPVQGAPFRAPLRVVEPKAPDPFKEGMDAAIAGKPAILAEDSPERADYMAGYNAGLTAKKQGIV